MAFRLRLAMQDPALTLFPRDRSPFWRLLTVPSSRATPSAAMVSAARAVSRHIPCESRKIAVAATHEQSPCAFSRSREPRGGAAVPQRPLRPGEPLLPPRSRSARRGKHRCLGIAECGGCRANAPPRLLVSLEGITAEGCSCEGRFCLRCGRPHRCTSRSLSCFE